MLRKCVMGKLKVNRTEEEMFLTLESFDFAFYCIIYYKIIKIGSISNNIDYYFVYFHYHYLCQRFYTIFN